jgi:hypothetical protein
MSQYAVHFHLVMAFYILNELSGFIEPLHIFDRNEVKRSLRRDQVEQWP